MRPHFATEDPIDTWPRRVAEIVGGSLLCLGLLNLLASLYLARNPVDVGHFLLLHKWELLEREGPVDIVVLGDSTVAFAFEPEIFERETGLKCLNLSTVGGALVVNSAWMLDAYITIWGPPKAVVLIHGDTVWEAGSFTAEYLASVPSAYRTAGRLRVAIPYSEQWQRLATRYLALYSQNSSVARVLRSGPDGPIVRLSPRGFPLQPEGSYSPSFRDQAGSVARMKESRPFRISAINLSALDAIKRLCLANRCPLILVQAPIFEEVTRQDTFSRYSASVQACFDGLAEADQNIVYLFRRPFVFGPDEARDSVHLAPKGAQRFTLELVELIRKRSEGQPDE